MNKLFASIAVTASAFMFAGCSNDELMADAGANEDAYGKFYSRITLSLPQPSRSQTTDPNPDGPTNSTGGYEVGLDPENKVSSVLVILASKVDAGNYSYITSSIVDSHDASVTPSDKTLSYNVQFEAEEVEELATKTVYVFTFCNPTPKLLEATRNKFADAGGFIDLTGLITDGSISRKNAFLMSNAEIVESTLPEKAVMEEKHSSPETPFVLGTVKVQRATARFDFKSVNNNRYEIKKRNTTEVIGYVNLNGMALMNEAKNYYFLSRTNDTGENTDMNICGPELPWLWNQADDTYSGGTYVVSPFASYKTAKDFDYTWIADNYRYSYSTPAGIDFSKIEEFDALDNTGRDEDNKDDSTWGEPGMDKSGYYIWKYVTENTIPGINAQRKAVTTGIVFRGNIEPVANSPIKAPMDARKVIYAYNGVLIGDFAMLKKTVVESPASLLSDLFKTTFEITGDINTVEDLDKLNLDETKITGASGFTVYRPDANGNYPVYYVYYNRHNDNFRPTVMGPMEFATVRNNIYKLRVDNILEFGHPGDPKDDPDPEDPKDPDESPKTYFSVEVQVLPWVVRVNNIIL